MTIIGDIVLDCAMFCQSTEAKCMDFAIKVCYQISSTTLLLQMYRILCIKILYDDKVESPVHLPNSMVQMGTVGPQCLLASSHTNPREMVQLDTTISAVCSENSSIHLFECVWKVFLRAFGEDKPKVRQCRLILCECTVLYFQGHRLCELAGC